MRTPNNISKPHPQEPSGQRLSRVNMASGDPTLDEIRARRLAELQAQYGGGGGGGASDEAEKQKEEMRRKQDEMKNSILTQILEQDARARLNSIALVKPERARQVEGMLIQMAQTGQIVGKVGEAQLVDLLEKFSQHTQKKTTIKFERKRLGSDDDDF